MEQSNFFVKFWYSFQYCSQKLPFRNLFMVDALNFERKGLDKPCRPRSDCWRTCSVRVFPVCYSDNHFVNSTPDNQHFIWDQKEKSDQNFRTFTVFPCYCQILFLTIFLCWCAGLYFKAWYIVRIVCWQTILTKYHVLFFWKLGKMSQSLLFASDVIGVLRVKVEKHHL